MASGPPRQPSIGSADPSLALTPATAAASWKDRRVSGSALPSIQWTFPAEERQLACESEGGDGLPLPVSPRIRT
jgi:hypothetical protein